MNPFFNKYLIDWLASQTMARAEKIVTDEVKSRMEKGDLGSYDGVLFKNAFRSQSSRISVGSVDLGVVAAAKEELVGLIDKMGTPKVVKGDAFKYYIGSWKGLRIVAVETGHGLDKARRGTEALLQAFRPERVASIGFVKSLVKSLEPGAFFVPNRLLLEDGSELDLSQPKLAPPKGEESADPEAAAPPEETAPEKESETQSAPEEEGAAPESERRPIELNSAVKDFLSRFATGALVSVDRDVVDASDRKELAKRVGASAVDRVAWSVAQTCGEAGVPFLALRVVYDFRAQAGSKEAARVVDTSGVNVARTFGALFGAVTKRPHAALDLYKLKEQSLQAADKLVKALGMILSAAAKQ